MLDSLLLPGTPQHVRKQYYRLEEQAAVSDFDLLEDGIVVLDTETTGLSFRDCELIEIAAARLSGREVVERYHTFVHPGRPIPPEIQRLTRITDLDVTDAPEPRDAVAGLAEFVGGAPILAHNATFDRTFVEKVPGGSEVSDMWIDTLALSRIALPRLRSHRLADMAQAFHCDSVTHRAMDDVDALCGMWRIILCALRNLPEGLLAYLAEMHTEVDWAFRPIIAHLAGEGDVHFDLKAIRRELLAGADGHRRQDANDLIGSLSYPSEGDIRSAFAQDGIVSQMYGSYESRPEQVQMALEVRDALATSTHRGIEAGTGVGKSIAYLLPEVLFAQENHITVGIATKTNALTDQLVTHELPALNKALPGGVSYYSLKGYEHYPCIHRMDRAVRDELPINLVDTTGRSTNTICSDMLTALAVCYAFSCQSPDGDVDALGIRWKAVPRGMVTTTSSECIKNRCPYYPNECFVHGARRRAAGSDVVVTNHSLLLRNIAADNAILPPVRHWVVDEAHGFQAEARHQWAREISNETVRTTFETLGGTKTGTIHSLMVRLAKGEAATLHVGLLTKAAAAISRASVSLGDFFVQLHELTNLAKDSGDYDGITLWIDQAVRASDEWKQLTEIAETCTNRLNDAVKFLEDANADISAAAPQLAGELDESAQSLRDILGAMNLIISGEDESYVYSAQLYRQKKRIAKEKLMAEKLDIGSDLATKWLPQMQSVIYTSATIAVGKSFEHFNHEVGFDVIDKSKYKDIALESSYDFDKSMSVLVAQDMPQPNDRRYIDALCDLLFDVHTAMGGSVLTLFTNRREMERVYRMLEPQLAQQGLELVCQDRGSSPRRLRERFLEDKALSLFALKSFWEGFDASGDTLRCVVIPKLPFASPRDPLVRERDKREDRAWWRYSLPEAVISVKQAAGRLIRSSSDTGVLVLADSRLVQKRYGKQFIESLPSHNCVRLEQRNIGKYIRLWLASRK